MSKYSIALTTIAAILMLCQWFVFLSLRKYLFPKCEEIQRRTAYPVLIGFGLITIVAARLEFGSEIFTPGTFGRQLASIIVYSYLGWAVVLSLVFMVVGAICSFVKLKDAVLQATIRKTRPHSSSASERVRFCPSLVEGPKEPKPEAKDNHGQSSSGSEPVEATQINYQHPSRRAFLRTATATGLVAAAGFGFEGIAEGYSLPVVERYELFHDLLQDLGKPVTIVHVTDCHFGMFFGLHQLRDLVHQLNSLDGDALCITGDVFHSAATVVEQATPLLKKLKARKLGNFAVLGNHDFYAGEIRSVENLEAAGIVLLRNHWSTLRVGKSMIHIGGVDDPLVTWMHRNECPGFHTLMSKAPVEAGFHVLLSHRPGVFPQAAQQNIDLVLAGHTHGGQIVIPVPGLERGVSVADMVSDYTRGRYRSNVSRMYLSRGVGFTFLPWRIHCPPEIAVIRLNPAGNGIKSGFFRRA